MNDDPHPYVGGDSEKAIYTVNRSMILYVQDAKGNGNKLEQAKGDLDWEGQVAVLNRMITKGLT